MAGMTKSYSNSNRENLVINGDYTFWQRGTSAPVTIQTYYTADRWMFASNGAGLYTVSQSTDVPTPLESGHQSKYSSLITITSPSTPSGSDWYGPQYRIEGYDLATLPNKYATLSFWVKSSVVGTYSVSFAANSSTLNYVSEYTINQANTWEKKEISVYFSAMVTHPSYWNFTNVAGIYLTFNLGVGATSAKTSLDQWTSNSWYAGSVNQVPLIATNGATFQTSQIMLNEGPVAQPFKIAGDNIAGEFLRCQRYFQYVSHASLMASSTSTVEGHLHFPVPMRSTPTVGAASTITIERHNITTYTQTSAVASFNSPNSNLGGKIALGNFGGALTAGNFYSLGEAGGKLYFIAEL